MNQRITEAIRIVAPILVLAVGWFGYKAIGQRPPQETREPDADAGQLVETVPVDAATDGMLLAIDGTVVPYREIALAAEVGGRVTYKMPGLQAGRFVTQGTKLLEIDTEVYDIARQRVEAEWEQAKIALAEVTEVEHPNLEGLIALTAKKRQLAANELSRVRQLQRDGVATQASVDTAEQADLQAANELTSLQNQLRMLVTKEKRLSQAVKVARAYLASAERDLERATVVAPITGVIVRDEVELNGSVAKGAPLFVIEDTAKVEIRSNLTQDELAWILRDERADAEKPATPDEGEATIDDPHHRAYRLPSIPVTVSFELAGRTYEWDGEFSRYDGLGLDERTRTVPCRLVVPDPRTYRVDGSTGERGKGPRALVRGMFVNVRTRIQPGTPMLRLPERSVKPGGDVWRVGTGKEGERVLDIVPLNIAWREEGLVYVTSDGPLAAKDRLVVSPLSDPSPGTKLRLEGESKPEKKETSTPVEPEAESDPDPSSQPTSPDR